MWGNISKTFFNGIIILLPLLITIYILWLMFSFADGIFGGFISLIVGHPLPGVGFLITIILIFLAGYFGRYLIGERLIDWADQILRRVPVVKSIYSSIKQINDVLFVQNRAKGETEYRRPAVVEYPSKGIYSIGFVTTEAAEEINKKTGHDLVSVFIPNTPTPATGFLIMVSKKDVKLLDMKVEEAFKLIVSGGVLKPKHSPYEHI